jgi:magnesium transporter
MNRRKRISDVGQPPGTLIYTGKHVVEKERITVMEYDADSYREREVEALSSCFPLKGKPAVTWINLDGLHNTALMEEIGASLGIHPLVQEDILNVSQRPKMDDMGDYLFFVVKMLYRGSDTRKIETEQVSILVGDGYVISFQERRGDVFDPIRDRIREAKGRVRRMGADYLAYALLDAVVDNYFPVLEMFGENLETVEQELLEDPRTEMSATIHAMKRELIFLRRAVWPVREFLASLERREAWIMQRTTLLYMRDLYDHAIQLMEAIETYRDMVTGLLDVYLSSLSNRMNQVMKVLTLIATIFIPLTFIAGIYGMNFQHMPELGWKWAYPAVLGGMTAIGLAMLVWFKRKRWL